MTYLKRSLLFVPLLALSAICSFPAHAYADANPSDHGGVTAQPAGTASPCTVDVTVAPAPLDVSHARATALDHASPTDTHGVNLATIDDVADDRRDTPVFGSPCYDKSDARGCPPYTPGLSTLTFSTITFTASGVTSVRPARLNC